MGEQILPTPAELSILNVLWRSGAATVRQIHESLKRSTPVAYTTTLKVLQIMLAKGLVKRDDSSRSHVYEAADSEEQMQTGLVEDLLERAFGGKSSALVVRALAAKPASGAELEEIRTLLDDLEGEP